MNIEMLKLIVDLAGNGWGVEPKLFFEHYEETPVILSDLKHLEHLGYIRLIDGSGNLFDISVAARAKEYFI